MARTILIVDDEKSILRTLEGALSDENYSTICVESGEAAIDKISEEMPDLVLLDIWMPGIGGIDTLIKIRETFPNLQVIMMSGHGTIETAVKATKLGAYDFIEKPLSLEKLLLTIENAFKHSHLEEQIDILTQQQRKNYYKIVGNSSAIIGMKEQIKIVAPTNAWVLITGENGTGKELVARNIHSLSKRSSKPLVEVNCAAIPEDLIESELFGHEKGAFTGATTMRKGKFDLAHEGTLFLDEIGDMSLKTQSKTLRILQEQRFERVGGSRTINVDVRVLAATNKSLEYEIEQGRFREDLYFRLNVIPIHVPALRDRTEDLPDLIKTFVESIHKVTNIPLKFFSEDAIACLKNYNWPGNIRELKNLIERLMIMVQGEEIYLSNIPKPYNKSAAEFFAMEFNLFKSSFKDARNNFERMYILQKLEETEGNVSKAATVMGIERSNLHKKLKSLGLDDKIKHDS